MHKQEKINAKNERCFGVIMYDTIIKFKMIRINCEIMKQFAEDSHYYSGMRDRTINTISLSKQAQNRH